MRTIFISLLFLLSSFMGNAQKFTISGFVDDALTGEKLIGANVYETSSLKGSIANTYGFYSVSFPAGEVTLSWSFVGYKSIKKTFSLTRDTIINLSLSPTIELEEILVVDSKAERNVESTEMSVLEVPIKTIQSLPVLLGEVDIIKTIQLLPGVQSGNEGFSGLYVRGGGPDQNLILLDGVPVYNVNHLFGFFSVFNADAIQNIKLVKGGFPARYGGRLSSVLDIRMKEGNKKEFKGRGSVGLISSRLTLEGPIGDKTSYIISGRRTYIDVLAWPAITLVSKQEDIDKFRAGYYFYDLNAKINHEFSDKSKLYLSTYAGNDKAYFKMNDKYEDESQLGQFRLQWGNITSALRWNYMISPKLFSNTTLTYSRYLMETGVGMNMKQKSPPSKEEFEMDYHSGINDVAAKVDFDFYPNTDHSMKFGAGYTYHTFEPGVNAFKIKIEDNENTEKIDTTFGNKNIYAGEFYAYAEDDMKIGSRLKVNAGLHFSGFNVKGEQYLSLQPRLSARLLVADNWSIKASYSRMTQYIHLLSNSGIGLPTDLWLPVTDTIKPMQAEQFAIGSVYGLNKSTDISIEGFYKKMDNLIEYKDGASFLLESGDWQQMVEVGEGWSYGLEILLQKTIGNTTGWIGYTLSWSERQFENISFGKRFPYKYDRRHDISVVVNHKFNDRIDVGLTWVYGTGNAATLGVEKYSAYLPYFSDFEYYTETIEHIEKRNNFRMPSYHRLDLGVNIHKKLRLWNQTWSFGVYNAYNRKNPFFVMFDTDWETDKTVLKQYSLFPIIPSISYKFSF